MKIMGTINKEYLSSEQCTRTALVKRLRFLHARKFLLPVRFNYKLMDQPEGYTGRDVMIGCQAVDDEGAARWGLLIDSIIPVHMCAVKSQLRVRTLLLAT